MLRGAGCILCCDRNNGYEGFIFWCIVRVYFINFSANSNKFEFNYDIH